jgi:asparagine synthase (glutamine-hydrolysing)
MNELPRDHQTNGHRYIQAAAGPRFSGDSVRARPTGRIGGLGGLANAEALQRLRTSLGPGSSLLTEAGRLVVDHDHCLLEGLPLDDLDKWFEVVRDGRIAEVTGAFALAWVDDDGSLLLARDAIGERTLFYSQTSDTTIFASTVSALLSTGLLTRELNLSAVATYLTYAYLPGGQTLIRGIHELLPGEIVHLRGDTVKHEQYWLPPEEPSNWRSEDELRRSLRECLETTVRRQLPAGESVGVFLSGGLDSSLVVALARKLHDAPVITYSVSFGPNYANELSFSSIVASHCETDHHIVELSPEAVLHHLDESIALLSNPIGDPLTVPNVLLFREASRRTGVVLNGEGGDPCFGGPKNLPMLLAELYGDPNADRFARERAYLRAHLKCYDDLDLMFTSDVRDAIDGMFLEKWISMRLSDPRWRTFITRLQAINVVFKGGHHILPKVDSLSFPFGVLPRSPLFDQNIVELAFAIPPQLKLRGSLEKYLLKRAVRELLPAEIIDRPKSGMMVPVEGWFQGPLLPQARERLLDGLAVYRLFNRDYLERLLKRQLGGLRPRHGVKTWLLITLEAWLRNVYRG